MLYFSRWKALATLLTALIVCLFAVPNFFSDATLKRLPAWAQRHVVLGLDLQGGSHILLEVDANYVRKEKAEQLIQRQGVDRILVQVPGLSDPERLIKLIGQTAKLTFRMVDTGASVEQA